MSAATVIHWFWRYGSLSACEHDDVEEAARCAWVNSGAGEELTMCIEVISDGVSSIANVTDLYAKFDAAEDAEIKEAAKNKPVSCAQVCAPEVTSDPSGSGRWANYEWYYSKDEELEKYPALVALFGPERVGLKAL